MTKRRKILITSASVLFVLAVLVVILLPALHRSRCCAFQLQVATWQRAMLQDVRLQLDEGAGPPTSFVRVIAAASSRYEFPGRGVESSCWDQKNNSVRIGNLSLIDILKGEATLEEVDTEAARLNLPVPRWEVFGGLAFLVYDPGDQLRTELPVMLARMNLDRAVFNVGFEAGNVMFEHLSPERIKQMQTELDSHNLPPLPDSFLSHLPQ